MPSYFNRHTATGSGRVQKINLFDQGEIDLEEIRKTDVGIIPIRIDKNTIKLVKQLK